MNSEGLVKQFTSKEQAEIAGFNIPVSNEEMTEKQTERLKNDAQPVVSKKDHRSKFGKKLTVYNSGSKNAEKRFRREMRGKK